MTSAIDQALQNAVTKILVPLARLFLSHGAAYGLFEELARDAFVKAGYTHMERAGRRPTVSGVAALTGLSRKAVKQLSEADGAEEASSRLRYNRAVRVLSGWVNDERFQNNDEPAVLSIEQSPNSFSDLVREYSGDVPPVALLKVLEEAGNVRVEDGKVELLSRAYIPMDTEPDVLNILGVDVAELINTVSINITAQPGERRFQRKVSTAYLRRDALEEFREYSNARSQALLEDYDAWLTSREVSSEERGTDNAAYVAVGIYYSEGLD